MNNFDEPTLLEKYKQAQAEIERLKKRDWDLENDMLLRKLDRYREALEKIQKRATLTPHLDHVTAPPLVDRLDDIAYEARAALQPDAIGEDVVPAGSDTALTLKARRSEAEHIAAAIRSRITKQE